MMTFTSLLYSVLSYTLSTLMYTFNMIGMPVVSFMFNGIILFCDYFNLWSVAQTSLGYLISNYPLQFAIAVLSAIIAILLFIYPVIMFTHSIITCLRYGLKLCGLTIQNVLQPLFTNCIQPTLALIAREICLFVYTPSKWYTQKCSQCESSYNLISTSLITIWSNRQLDDQKIGAEVTPPPTPENPKTD